MITRRRALLGAALIGGAGTLRPGMAPVVDAELKPVSRGIGAWRTASSPRDLDQILLMDLSEILWDVLRRLRILEGR